MSDWRSSARWWSDRMQTEIGVVRWGHWGVPVLALPTSGGDADQVEREHLLAHLMPFIEEGRVKVYSCDSIGGRALHDSGASVGHRSWLLNQFQQAVAYEVVPWIQSDSAGGHEVIVAGASIGAFNALSLICRWPWLFRSAICLSGTYEIERFVGGSTDDLYYATAVRFLPGLGGPELDRLRQRMVWLASGSGAWEDVGESWRAAAALGAKGVPNRVDDWGPEFPHDWPTWWRMLPTYLQQAL